MEERAKPGTIYVALTDIYSAAGLLFPVVFLLLAGLVAVTGGSDEASGYVIVAAVAAIVGLPLSWWRVRHIRATLTHGVEVEGVVTAVRSGRSRSGNSHIKWRYTYDGRDYRGDAYVSSGGEVRPPSVGSKIRLWVNPARPQWSVWRDLYSSSLALGKG